MTSEASGNPWPDGPARGAVLSVQPVAEQGGSDQALLRLARQLGAAGWSVHLALPAPSPLADEYARAGATVHVVPMARISTSHGARAWLAYALGWPVSVARLWALARRHHVDLVHTNSLHSWYGWAVARLARRRHLWHAREIVSQSAVALGVERYLARRFAYRVFAASEAVAAQLHPGNVVVVHEEPSPDEFFPGRAGRARALSGMADDVLAVGYVGRLDTWKGIDVLLAAITSLRQQSPGLQVVLAGAPVAGKEGYAGALRRQAQDQGALWLGPLSGPAAGDLIADLDCVVYASTQPEPWGLVIVEALACGTPVVTTDAGGPREIMAGLAPAAGRLVPQNDVVALAEAVAQVLPSATSSEMRQARLVLRAGPQPDYPGLFAEALGGRPDVAAI